MKVAFVKKIKKQHILNLTKITFWFSAGAFLAITLITTLGFYIFQKAHQNVVYPGVFIEGVNFGGKTQKEVATYFAKRNEMIYGSILTLNYNNQLIATVSAKDISLGYNENLLATQALSIGRTNDSLINLVLIGKGYLGGVYLSASYNFSQNKLENILSDFLKNTEKDPVDALFNFENGRVKAFRPSSDGLELNKSSLEQEVTKNAQYFLSSKTNIASSINIPMDVLKPKVSTEQANSFGIKELIGTGTSLFAHSIPGRIYNVNLASSKFNGVLIAPDEVFSFDKVLGDVSAYTGYKQAYIIQNGKTILGDGGGVCQVSTTFFRAILNAGLPVIERHAHSYRVGYYEQDSPLGIDATTYYPSVDLKFKNDTKNHILVQTVIDLENLRLTFYLYGTSDGRITELGKPIITSQTPAPPDLYQDDPTLPKGQIRQIDFAAAGAKVYFTRKVSKDGKVIISDKFTSNYQPWQAIYLRGTKE